MQSSGQSSATPWDATLSLLWRSAQECTPNTCTQGNTNRISLHIAAASIVLSIVCKGRASEEGAKQGKSARRCRLLGGGLLQTLDQGAWVWNMAPDSVHNTSTRPTRPDVMLLFQLPVAMLIGSNLSRCRTAPLYTSLLPVLVLLPIPPSAGPAPSRDKSWYLMEAGPPPAGGVMWSCVVNRTMLMACIKAHWRRNQGGAARSDPWTLCQQDCPAGGTVLANDLCWSPDRRRSPSYPPSIGSGVWRAPQSCTQKV